MRRFAASEKHGLSRMPNNRRCLWSPHRRRLPGSERFALIEKTLQSETGARHQACIRRRGRRLDKTVKHQHRSLRRDSFRAVLVQ